LQVRQAIKLIERQEMLACLDVGREQGDRLRAVLMARARRIVRRTLPERAILRRCFDGRGLLLVLATTGSWLGLRHLLRCCRRNRMRGKEVQGPAAAQARPGQRRKHQIDRNANTEHIDNLAHGIEGPITQDHPEYIIRHGARKNNPTRYSPFFYGISCFFLPPSLLLEFRLKREKKGKGEGKKKGKGVGRREKKGKGEGKREGKREKGKGGEGKRRREKGSKKGKEKGKGVGSL